MKKGFLIACIIITSIINNQAKISREEYIETIPESAKNFTNLLEDTQVLLTSEEIHKYNNEIKKKADMVYDISNINSLSKEDILNYINQYKLPKYDENSQKILDNRNISQIQNQEKIIKGIIVKRTNLRSFPSEISIYTNEKKDFDRIQESELHVNTPVLIIHESTDALWNFVISPFYVGWIKKENVAIATDEDIEFFIKNDSFAIITEPIIKVEDTILDMSVLLPYVGLNKESYRLVLPQKGNDGYVKKEEIVLEKDKAHIGYLPYTKRNLCIQAFKYEGLKYSWGGKDIGVDCSSYIGNIYRTFGFYFPRNTSSQEKSIGKIISLYSKTSKEKLALIKSNYPCLLYQPGHVMLYLGEQNNKHYIIHASSMEMKVVLTELTENSNYIKSIDKIVIVI